MPPVKSKGTPTPAPTAPKAPPPAPKPAKAGPARPVVYPEPVIKEYRHFPDADHSLTVEDAKDILGWEEETDAVKFVKDCEECLTPLVGKKVRLVHNTQNRPIDVPWLLTLAQEHLNRRWRMNWETIIVSKTRQVNSGQHRLLSVILAELTRLKDLQDGGHWKKNWPGPVTMETLVVFGAEDSDDTFKTYNCGKAMSFADFLFRSDVLSRFDPHKRRGLAKVLEYAVRVLWDRTGLRKDAYSPRLTHGEADRFLRAHLRLVRAAEHVHEETTNNTLARENLCVGPGTATALVYLFAASATDPRAWREAAEPDEKYLDLGHWDRAEEFVSLLVGTSPDFRAVRDALGRVYDPETGCGTQAEAAAILIKAWNAFAQGEDPRAAGLKLEYEENEDGEGGLVYVGIPPDVGGIDRGPGGGEDEAGEDAPATTTPPKKPVPSKAQADADKAATTKAVDLDRQNQDLLRKLREDHAGKVLVFRAANGTGWRAFDRDAKLIAKTCGLTPAGNGVNTQVGFPAAKARDVVAALQAAGHKVAAVFPGSDGAEPTVEDYRPPEANGHAPTPKVATKKGKKVVNK